MNNAEIKKLVSEINKNNAIEMTATFDSDEQEYGYQIEIKYKGVQYANPSHYIDVYKTTSDITEEAKLVSNSIINGFEYEKEQLAQASIALTNDNRF